VGERHLPGLTYVCHELRRPDKSFRGKRLLGDVIYIDRGDYQSGGLGMDFVSVTERETSEAYWTVGITPVTEGVGLKVRDEGSWPDVLLGLKV
jgi:hypothetical protein